MSDAPNGAPPTPSPGASPGCPPAEEVAREILDSFQWALDAATALRSGAVAAQGAIPSCYLDVPVSQELAHSPLDVLGYLAKLWIISREPGAWARQVVAVFGELKKARAERGCRPVRIGPVTGPSLTEALWKAAGYVTGAMQGAFGCGRLVRIVRDVFPHDPTAHPSQIEGALLWLATSPFGGQALEQAVRAQGREPSRLTRLIGRFAGYDVREAVGAAQLRPLGEWLCDTFPGFDGALLSQELVLELSMIAPDRVQPAPICIEGGNAGQGSNDTLPDLSDLPTFLSASELARQLQQPARRVETFLRRYREDYSDCFVEVEGPRKNEPKVLYRTSDVWPYLLQKAKEWGD